MKKVLETGLVCGALLLSISAVGQSFYGKVPLGAMPMQFNSSFAGVGGSGRFHTNVLYYTYREHWRDYKWREYQAQASYDQFIPALGVGIGFTTEASVAGLKDDFADGQDNLLEEYTYRLAIAPKFSVKGKYTFSPSIDVGYTKMEFFQFDNSFISLPSNRQHERLSSRIGLLWNSSAYYIGYSVDILGNHFLNGPEHWARISYDFRSFLQAGYTFQRDEASNFSFTPQIALMLAKGISRGGYPIEEHKDELIHEVVGYTLNFRYKKLLWGFNNEGILLGFQNDRLRLSMTNDPRMFNGRQAYVGNLSFRYSLQEKAK